MYIGTQIERVLSTSENGVPGPGDATIHSGKGAAPGGPDKVSCPMIAESPLNLECRVVDVKKLPSHDMFMAEIVAVHADEKLMNSNGRLALERAGLVTLVHSGYHKCTRQPLGRMGYSVMKPSTKKRLAREGKRVSGAKPHKKHE